MKRWVGNKRSFKGLEGVSDRTSVSGTGVRRLEVLTCSPSTLTKDGGKEGIYI